MHSKPELMLIPVVNSLMNHADHQQLTID